MIAAEMPLLIFQRLRIVVRVSAGRADLVSFSLLSQAPFSFFALALAARLVKPLLAPLRKKTVQAYPLF